MEYLTIHSEPSGGAGYLITAFKGWPDAGEGASSAIRYLMRKLGVKKAAELDPEEFYDFAQVRPQTSITREGLRVIKWPANEIHYWDSGEPSTSLLFLLGVEPSLKWKTFAGAILDAAQRWNVHTVIQLGALLDAVPHTKAVRITGTSSRAEQRDALDRYDVHPSSYQGPTGITSAVMEACPARELSYANMWGHTPHYLQAAPNYKVSYALVSLLSRLLGFQVPLDELSAAAATFEREVDKAVNNDPQISAYVSKLEQRYEESEELVDGEMPQPEELVKELEEFLKEQQKRDGGNGPPA